MDENPTLHEVGLLYQSLDQEARDEFLQTILISASVSWEQVATVIESMILKSSIEADLREL